MYRNITRTYLLLSGVLLFSMPLSAKTDTIRIVNTSFQPSSLRIKAGTTVVWYNPTEMVHTSTSGTDCNKDGKWNSGYLEKGQSFKFTFTEAGTFPYFCIPHCLSGMKGVIIVTAGGAEEKKQGEGKKTGENETQDSSSMGLAPTDEKYPRTFGDNRIINAQTNETLGKHLLDFRIMHRFDDIRAPKGGAHYFFGLDNMRDVRLALEYGITDNLMIGLSRSKGDRDNYHVQQVYELYEGLIKYRLIRQTADKKMPVSVTLFGNAVLSGMKQDTISYWESNFQNSSSRWSYLAEAIIARRFNSRLSLELLPVYLIRNWVKLGDEKSLFALGAAGRYRVSKRLSIVADYFHPFSSYRTDVNKNPGLTHYYDPLAVGIELNTGGHAFTINLSNSTGVIENTFIPYTTSSWSKGDIRIGFTISRKFNIQHQHRMG